MGFVSDPVDYGLEEDRRQLYVRWRDFGCFVLERKKMKCSFFHPFPFGNHKFFFSVCESMFCK